MGCKVGGLRRDAFEAGRNCRPKPGSYTVATSQIKTQRRKVLCLFAFTQTRSVMILYTTMENHAQKQSVVTHQSSSVAVPFLQVRLNLIPILGTRGGPLRKYSFNDRILAELSVIYWYCLYLPFEASDNCDEAFLFSRGRPLAMLAPSSYTLCGGVALPSASAPAAAGPSRPA